MPTWPQWRQLPSILTKKERLWISLFGVLAVVSAIAWLWSAYLENTVAIPAHGGTYTEAIVGEPKFINPLLTGLNDADRDISALVFSGLMKYDGTGNLVPDLAERYELSADGREYVFYLRKNVQWHDGRAFGADDVLFTFSAIVNPEYQSPLRGAWQGVTAEKSGDDAVKIILPKPHAPFLERLTIGIMPRHIWEGVTPRNTSLAGANLKPIGTGPFLFSKFTKDKLGNIISYTLSANNHFFGVKPFLKEVTFYFYAYDDEALGAYMDGKAMGLGNVPPFYRDQVQLRGRTVRELNIPKYFGVFFNQTRAKALVDKNVRIALAESAPIDDIIREVLSGNGIKVDSPLLSWMKGYASDVKRYTFSLEHAKEILDSAGWKDKDGDGVREKTLTGDKEPTNLEFSLITSDFPDLIRAGELLKDKWENIGARVNLETFNSEELKRRIIKPRKYDALLFGEALTLNPDPYLFWHSSQKKDPGLNLSLYDNKEVDRMLESIRESVSESERAEHLKKVQETIADELPVLFLFSPYYLYVMDEDVRGVTAQTINVPARRFSGIEQWYIKTQRIKKEGQ